MRCSDDNETLNTEEAQKRWAQTEKYAADLRKASSASPPKMRAKYTSRCFKMLVVSWGPTLSRAGATEYSPSEFSWLLHILETVHCTRADNQVYGVLCHQFQFVLYRLALQGLARQPSFRIWHLPTAHRMTVRVPSSEAEALTHLAVGYLG